ncbi:MAG: hypothetical protein PVJ60_02230 [Phycisphaerales bacterium]
MRYRKALNEIAALHWRNYDLNKWKGEIILFYLWCKAVDIAGKALSNNRYKAALRRFQ